jgi:putative GTP pyrophosphokinase
MAKKKKNIDSRAEGWISEYRDRRPIYERYCSKIETLLEELLSAGSITYHVVESRAKSVDSFAEKLKRQGKEYLDPLREITDLAGMRIILYYTNDVIKVNDLIETEFSVDRERSLDKKTVLAPDQFGYLSVHKIVRISPSRARLAEWAHSYDLTAEIQIRTVLQHSWAAISHALQYKHEADVPDEFRRRLTRLSGLLELADVLRRDIAGKVSEGNLDISIDALSVREFVRTSNIIKEIANHAAKANIEIREAKEYDDISQLVRASQLSHVLTIKELESVLTKAKAKAGRFFQDFIRGRPYKAVGSEAHVAAIY